MERKDIRKILKKWVYRENTEYNCLKFTFVNVGIHGTKMNAVFESLVDEVYNMAKENKSYIRAFPFNRG